MNIIQKARNHFRACNEYYCGREFGIDASMKQILLQGASKNKVSNPYLLALLKIRMNRLG